MFSKFCCKSAQKLLILSNKASFARTLLDFLFPPLCIHCDEPLHYSSLICKACASSFELIDPFTRCMGCFSELGKYGVCNNCLKKRKIPIAAAIDLTLPAMTMLSGLKDGKIPSYAKTLGMLMVLQLERLDWPSFDVIIPIPKRLFLKKENHAKLLADVLGKHYSISVRKDLGRISGDPPAKMRKAKEKIAFFVKKGADLERKKILLVDDIIFSGQTLQDAGECLRKEFVCEVYGLSAAKVMRETD